MLFLLSWERIEAIVIEQTAQLFEYVKRWNSCHQTSSVESTITRRTIRDTNVRKTRKGALGI